MKKIIELIKKHDNILVFILTMICISGYAFFAKLSIGDELWNFSFAYKYANGYELYTDLNNITTPLFLYICRMIFYIFGDSYISFRIYNLITFSTFFTVIYILLKKIRISKINAFAYTLFFFIFSISIIPTGANYNVLACIFVIIGIILQLSKKNIRNYIFSGIILFAIFMSKQNIFVYYVLAMLIVSLLKYLLKRESTKEISKRVLVNGVTLVILILGFVLCLWINNQLYDFISYCFLGIKEFGEKNATIMSNKPITYIAIGILSIIVSAILLKTKGTNSKIKDVNLILLPYSATMLFGIIPIVNIYHTIIASYISIILLIYNLHNIIIIFIKEKTFNKIAIIFSTIVILYNLSMSIYWSVRYIPETKHDIRFYPYIGIVIERNLANKINNICEYIKENEMNNIEVRIISQEADLYMNILKKNNKNTDLPFLGNLGKDGEEGLIKEVSNLKSGTKILISKENVFWQESKRLREKIMNEYKRIGEVEDFYIYEK